jgi:hypothetical protein
VTNVIRSLVSRLAPIGAKRGNRPTIADAVDAVWARALAERVGSDIEELARLDSEAQRVLGALPTESLAELERAAVTARTLATHLSAHCAAARDLSNVYRH